MVSHLLRDPLAWLWLSLSSASWPLLAAFSPLGLTTSNRNPAEALYEVAFLSGLLGASLGAALLVRGSWFLSPLSTRRRLAVEATGLATSGCLFPAIALGVAALCGAPLSWGLVAGTLLSMAHLAALGLLLLRAPVGPVTAGLALPAIAWALPALLAGASPPGPGLSRVLGAAQHTSEAAGTAAGLWPQLMPILGLVLASGLLHRASPTGTG